MDETRFCTAVEKIKTGDKQGLKEIYEAYIGYIYTIVYQIVQNKENAEDITSEFFIKLWEKAAIYRAGNGGHRGFLATIARNMSIDFMRKSGREQFFEEEQEEQILQTSEANSVEAEVIEELSVKEALDRLEYREREIVHLKVMGELTFQEIADILRIPLGTVTWKYRNALQKLRRCGYRE